MNSQLLKNPFVIAFTAFAAGGGVGFVIGSRRRKVEVETVVKYIQSPAIDEIHEDPNQLELNWEDTPDGQEYQKIIEQEGYLPIVDVKMEERAASETKPEPYVFVKFNEDDDWDYAEELSLRAALPPDAPYIISVEEYLQNEDDRTQTLITYYAGDDVLVDENETPIPNRDKIVGDLRFGHGSNDANVVYVRNPKLDLEWEIVYDRGTYQEEVLGLEIEKAYPSELRHSGNSIRKFKLKDG